MTVVSRVEFLLRGLIGRVRQQPRCPSCSVDESSVVDRKWSFTLRRCDRCGLLFRFPADAAAELEAFYQGDYDPGGLTTDLPSPAELRRYLDEGFAGTSKDFSNLIAILRALRVPAGARVLDYGANWGYLTHQLRRAGYDADAFEISVPRAAYGRNLGITIKTRLDDVRGPFDAVYSSHVLEHVADPRATLLGQWERVRPGALLLGHTPNGSAERRTRDWKGFHTAWGQVHPVLLTAEFLSELFRGSPMYVSSESDAAALAAWDGQGQMVRELGGGELFFVVRKTASSPATEDREK